ncbi:MAG: hypothetical protein MI743_14895 [Sneathiellales bacterium]|nr:hypothetical protein [Sneathiellales bacterium]
MADIIDIGAYSAQPDPLLLPKSIMGKSLSPSQIQVLKETFRQQSPNSLWCGFTILSNPPIFIKEQIQFSLPRDNAGAVLFTNSLSSKYFLFCDMQDVFYLAEIPGPISMMESSLCSLLHRFVHADRLQ